MAGSVWEHGASQCLECREGICTPNPGSPPTNGTATARRCPARSHGTRDLWERKQRDGVFWSRSKAKSRPAEGLRDPGRVPCSRVQEPLCHHVWAFGESSQVRKHQPKGLSGAGLRNPPTHSPSSASAASPPPPSVSPRGHGTVVATLLSALLPVGVFRSPLGIPACPDLPCPSQPPVEPQIHPQPGPGTLHEEPLPMGLQ